jgi:hypothetical protein
METQAMKLWLNSPTDSNMRLADAYIIGGWPVEFDALKRLQAETAAELDALLPAILQSSLGFNPTGNRAFKGEL